MADKPLGRAWYAVYRETTNDVGRVLKDPYGYFSCRLVTARFLNIEDKQYLEPIPGKKRKEGIVRTLTLADGTILRRGVANTDGKNAVNDVGAPLRKTVGGKNVLLRTGKLIRPVTDANPSAAYHTISFAFPSWADIKTISQALGETIPTTKISASPGATEIYGNFTIKGGGTYPISSQASANADQSVISSNSGGSNAALKAKIAAKSAE